MIKDSSGRRIVDERISSLKPQPRRPFPCSNCAWDISGSCVSSLRPTHPEDCKDNKIWEDEDAARS